MSHKTFDFIRICHKICTLCTMWWNICRNVYHTLSITGTCMYTYVSGNTALVGYCLCLAGYMSPGKYSVCFCLPFHKSSCSVDSEKKIKKVYTASVIDPAYPGIHLKLISEKEI